MLHMVRTLAQFSIALEEMNENGENTGDERGGGGGEEVVDRDAVDQLKNNNRTGNFSGNLNGNGLCAGSPNGEVDAVFSLICSCVVCICVFPVLHLYFISRTYLSIKNFLHVAGFFFLYCSDSYFLQFFLEFLL